MKKIYIIVLILVSTIAGGYFLVQRLLRDPAQLLEKLPEIAKHLEFELDNVRYGHTRLGVKKWELSTRKAKRIKGQKNILLEGVTARIYADGKLKDDTQIQADRGSYLVDRGDMELRGAVKIKNKQFNIETERLLYRADSEQIEAPEKVLVESKSLNIKANRATIDLKQQKLHFSGAVKATIWLETKKTVTAGKARSVKFSTESLTPISVKNNKAVKKNIKLVRPKNVHKTKPEIKIRKH